MEYNFIYSFSKWNGCYFMQKVNEKIWISLTNIYKFQIKKNRYCLRKPVNL